MEKIHTVSQCTMTLTSPKSWIITSIFVVGSVFFTQLFMLLSIGSLVWLPYLFISIFVAYKYGWKMGVITAIVSPALNYIIFAEPGIVMLSAVMFTGALAVGVTSFVSFLHRRK
ncbi:MAG: hypothetical protein K2M07_08650 [Muribaculaceae bacterium]|nr:hypothetical protein [Muribaculaceae bacterium]